MHFIATCRAVPTHAVMGPKPESISGKPCQISGCTGTYQLVRFKTTGAPRPYTGTTIAVDVDGKRVRATARPLSDRQLRKDAPSDALKKKREETIRKMRMQAADEPMAVEDGGDYIGDAAPFKGVHSRLSVSGSYAARSNLQQIIATCSSHKLKMKHCPVDVSVDRGRGQTFAKGNRSAETASGRKLPKTDISSAKGGSQPAKYSEEWCHLQAASLGGQTVDSNLVAASYACNTYMMAIESYIRCRTELSLSVTAYCSDHGCEVAEAIKYRIYERKGTNLIARFCEIIDATAQHFSQTDLDVLKGKLRSSVPVVSAF